MMKAADEAFLERRRIYTRRWKWAAIVSLVILGAMAINLFINTPHMINPLHVSAMLESRELASSTILMMAMMLPYSVLFIFFLMLVLIVYGTVMIRNEKRYLKMIDKEEI